MTENTVPGFVGVNLQDIPDAAIAEPGEWLVKVENIVSKQSKAGSAMLVLQLSFPDSPDTEHFFDNLVMPQPDSNEKATRFLLRRLKAACEAFQVDWSAEGFDASEFLGKEALVQVDAEVYQEETRNVVKSYRATATVAEAASAM